MKTVINKNSRTRSMLTKDIPSEEKVSCLLKNKGVRYYARERYLRRSVNFLQNDNFLLGLSEEIKVSLPSIY